MLRQLCFPILVSIFSSPKWLIYYVLNLGAFFRKPWALGWEAPASDVSMSWKAERQVGGINLRSMCEQEWKQHDCWRGISDGKEYWASSSRPCRFRKHEDCSLVKPYIIKWMIRRRGKDTNHPGWLVSWIKGIDCHPLIHARLINYLDQPHFDL